MEPLALQLRPIVFDDVIGQPHLTNHDAVFRRLIESNNFGNFILFGPSGSGKTSIVSVIEHLYELQKFNATTFTAKEIRKVLDKDEKIIIMIDEIYRLTAPQSDILLPYLETSRVRCIGCSVENPFHSMRASLLSRCHIYATEPLAQIDIVKVILKGMKQLKQWQRTTKLSKEAARYISVIVNGDARKALSILETAYNCCQDISLDVVKKVAPSKYFHYSKDVIYDSVSFLQGAIQASDVNTAIYALARALEHDIDPRYIARRLLVCASEDSYSNPICTAVAHAAYIAACEIGRPECDLVMAQAVCLIATSKRDKTSHDAIREAIQDVRNGVHLVIPKPMRDCHSPGSVALGNGGYQDGYDQSQYVGISKKYFKPENWLG